MGFRDEMHETPAEEAVREMREKENKARKKAELLKRLEPFSQGCFSGHTSEWPQLRPLLKEVYDYLEQAPPGVTATRAQRFVRHIAGHLSAGQYVVCKICGKSIDEIAGPQ